jgi:ABC-type multidrug transport system, ATPase component
MELLIDHVSKSFKDKKAVRDFSLNITPGVWGLLGANGAGKTTLIRIITGIMKPESGQVIYDGIPIEILKAKYRDILGYLPQEFGFPPEFSVKDYLEYIASLKGLTIQDTRRRIEELLTELSLTDIYRKKIAKLSGGTRQRVGIAQALLNEPEILILDEPTSGLDPGERIRFRNMLAKFAQNRVVLISTHIVSDVEYIATENAIMKDGELIALGKTEELEKLVDGKVWCAVISAENLTKYESKTRIINMKSQDNGNILVRYLADEPFIDNSEKAFPNLDDVYFWLFPREGQVEKL